MRQAAVSSSIPEGVGLGLSAPAGAVAALTPQAPCDTSVLSGEGRDGDRAAGDRDIAKAWLGWRGIPLLKKPGEPWVSPPDLTEPLSFSSPQPGPLTSCSPGPSSPASPPAIPQAMAAVCPGPPALPQGTSCPSPTSQALGSTTGTQPDLLGTRRPTGPCSWARLLRRGCWSSAGLAALSGRCPAVPHGKVQPLGGRERRRPDSRRVSSFFQVRTPLESRACAGSSGQGQDRHPRARKDSAKELICPWETPREEGRAG
ncbi:regulator of G-protein signaling 9 [Catharus ustulatus]|uniref:regulator of G-protein signaling 9 n=1 Tax=Catharus ustulatus TaxID=91951 RepID=UPI0014085669|nr:regulator of G-protein signaling 9 [Catharus ustulatus]